jgi:hypothetical protein
MVVTENTNAGYGQVGPGPVGIGSAAVSGTGLETTNAAPGYE